MLGSRQSGCPGLLLAPMLEVPHSRPQLKQVRVCVICQFHSYHDSIVSR